MGQTTTEKPSEAADEPTADESASAASSTPSPARTAALARLLLLLGGVVVIGAAVMLWAPWKDDPARSFNGDGTYRVPEDIPPGLYRTDGGPNCHWERIDSAGVVVAEGDDTKPVVVGIRKSDKEFRSDGCGRWRQVRQGNE